MKSIGYIICAKLGSPKQTVVNFTLIQKHFTMINNLVPFASGTSGTVSPNGSINSLLTGVDYSSLMIRISYVNNTLLSSTDNYVRNLMVEVRKKI